MTTSLLESYNSLGIVIPNKIAYKGENGDYVRYKAVKYQPVKKIIVSHKSTSVCYADSISRSFNPLELKYYLLSNNPKSLPYETIVKWFDKCTENHFIPEGVKLLKRNNFTFLVIKNNLCKSVHSLYLIMCMFRHVDNDPVFAYRVLEVADRLKINFFMAFCLEFKNASTQSNHTFYSPNQFYGKVGINLVNSLFCKFYARQLLINTKLQKYLSENVITISSLNFLTVTNLAQPNSGNLYVKSIRSILELDDCYSSTPILPIEKFLTEKVNNLFSQDFDRFSDCYKQLLELVK